MIGHLLKEGIEWIVGIIVVLALVIWWLYTTFPLAEYGFKALLVLIVLGCVARMANSHSD
jgi:uncharacterized membrane protein YadS